jgi:D-tyrosyl-tRNA(Tyr) deacylase
MRIVLQRVKSASVRVDGSETAGIGRGFLLLVGVGRDDDAPAAERLAAKIAGLRVFEDEDGRFARSVLDIGGEALVVSQFTLLADAGKGTRPSFTDAAAPEDAEPLYERFCEALRQLGVSARTGVFGARMEVELVNDGPVTLVLET